MSDTTVPAPAEETVEAAKVEVKAATAPYTSITVRNPIVDKASYLEHSVRAKLGSEESRMFVAAAADVTDNAGLVPTRQLTAPTERPNEPQTAGMPFGPGTNFINLPPSTQRTPATVAYDVAIGGLPFFYGISNERPYIRQTAPYKKEQFDNSKEPGEQTLEGWWIRSQSSFHRGAGIKFYDPSAGEEVDYRFSDSEGVNVWTKGEVTLLHRPYHHAL